MSRSETEYLHHIQDETRYLIEASHEVSFDDFATDETLKRAFVRSIEVIGEATKKLLNLTDRYGSPTQVISGSRVETHPMSARERC